MDTRDIADLERDERRKRDVEHAAAQLEADGPMGAGEMVFPELDGFFGRPVRLHGRDVVAGGKDHHKEDVGESAAE